MFPGNENAVQSLWELLSDLEDPRDNRGKRHDLREIIVLIIVGFLLGKTDYVNIAHCLRLKMDELRKYLCLKNGIPSHDTFSNVTKTLDSKQLIYIICAWFCQLVDMHGKHLIIDGKGILAAAEKNRNKKTPYIMNVLEAASRMVLMQLKVGEKTNEITGIDELLDYIDVDDSVVTIDAIGTQKEIMNKIIKKKGHFVLPVKGNQHNLCSDITLFLDDVIKSNDLRVQKSSESITNDHGREEKRMYYSTNDISCILDDGFKMIRTIGKVVRERTYYIYDDEGQVIDKKSTVDETIYVSDLEMDVKMMSRYIRKHWTIENSLHWVLDNTFKEDRSTNKKGNSMENTALLRKVAYNIIRIHQSKLANCSFEYIIDEFAYNISTIMSYVF